MLSIKAILIDSFELVKKNQQATLVFILINTIIAGLQYNFFKIQFTSTEWILYFAINLVIGTYISTVFIYLIDKNETGHIPLEKAAKDSLNKLLPVLGTTLLVSFLTVIGMLLLIIPGLIFYTISSQAYFLTLFEGKKPVESIKISQKITKGKRMFIFKLFIVTVLFFTVFKLIGIALPTFDLLLINIFLTYYSLIQYSLWKAIKQSA